MDASGDLFHYVQTTCPYCGVGCGLNLVVSRGKLVGVEPYTRSPVNEGGLCIKGASCWEFVHSPDRLTCPLIKKDDEFVPASWDEALALVTRRFSEMADTHGPRSLAFQVSCRTTNEDCYLIQKWARAGFHTNNIDNCARLCHGPSVAGLTLSFGSGAATNPFEDMLNADLILVWGSNAVEAHPLAARRIIQAKKKGVPVIVVDPRFTPTSRLADLWVRPRPATQIALLNSVLYWILAEGREDQAFIEARTTGFSDLKKTVERYADVASVTGVPQETVQDLARRYAGAEKAAIVYCLGVTEFASGTDNVRSLGNLALLCGNIGRPGTGLNPLRGQNNVQGACDMGAYPSVFPGYQACGGPGTCGKMEKAWGVSGLPDWEGLTLLEQIDACGDTVKGMFILGLNPVVTFPDSGRVRAALKKLDFLVVQDIFPTETSRYADVVLPGACFAEKEGTFTSGERRINRVRKAVEPPGGAKADSEILCLLARNMGLAGFDFATPAEIWEEIRACTPFLAGAAWEKIERPESVHWPCPAADHPGTPILHIETFATPDGRGHFFGIEYRPPAESPDHDYPFSLLTGRLLFHYHSRTQTGRCGTLSAEVPGSFVRISPEDAGDLGIRNGDRVRLRSRRGEIETVAQVTSEVGPGVLFMPMHFAGGANVLTGTARDPLSDMPELKHSAVAVEKIA